jgi:maltooligosyltrehalose trehalohydrolase
MNEAWKIWAPYARSLEIVYGGRSHAARRLDDGHWLAEHLAPGTDYMIRIDGHDRPDPRSHCQPNGVHGASRQASHEFVWHDQEFRPTPLGSALV